MVEKRFARGVSHGFIFIMIGIFGGILGGISGSLFIALLNYAQNLRELNHNWIFILPLVGILLSFLRGAPKLILGSFLTHLGGGSAGREGAVIQLSRILAEKISSFFHFQERKARRLVIISMGAGFGAALGAPWAGVIFGIEFNKSKFIRPWTLLHSLIAMLIAQAIIRITHLPHFHLPAFVIPEYKITTLTILIITGILFGFSTAFFHFLRHQYEFAFKKCSPLITGLIGGVFLVILYYFFDLREYQGLGREVITQASQEILPLVVTAKKIILTVITLGSGFQGGEFFPLAFIGSTLGSAFSFIDPNMTELMVALGFVSTYGSSTQTPIACTLLAGELFGWKILPFAAITVWIASRIHSRVSITSKE